MQQHVNMIHQPRCSDHRPRPTTYRTQRSKQTALSGLITQNHTKTILSMGTNRLQHLLNTDSVLLSNCLLVLTFCIDTYIVTFCIDMYIVTFCIDKHIVTFCIDTYCNILYWHAYCNILYWHVYCNILYWHAYCNILYWHL